MVDELGNALLREPGSLSALAKPHYSSTAMPQQHRIVTMSPVARLQLQPHLALIQSLASPAYPARPSYPHLTTKRHCLRTRRNRAKPRYIIIANTHQRPNVTIPTRARRPRAHHTANTQAYVLRSLRKCTHGFTTAPIVDPNSATTLAAYTSTLPTHGLRINDIE